MQKDVDITFGADHYILVVATARAAFTASMAVIACLRGVLVVALHADLSAVLAIHSQPEAPWGARLMLPSCIDRMAMVTYRSGTHGGPIVDVFNDEINRRRLPSIPALAAEASLP